jgi:hypothetical protein
VQWLYYLLTSSATTPGGSATTPEEEEQGDFLGMGPPVDYCIVPIEGKEGEAELEVD